MLNSFRLDKLRFTIFCVVTRLLFIYIFLNYILLNGLFHNGISFSFNKGKGILCVPKLCQMRLVFLVSSLYVLTSLY